MGIVLRIFTFLALGPDNPDAHTDILKFILKFHALPHALQSHEAYSPPLYYILATPLLALFGYAKGAQLLSLVFSIGTLIVLHRLIYRTDLIRDPHAKLYCFLLAAFLPQFIIFSLFVSNDTLAIFLGALTILQAYRFASSPDWRQLNLLALLVGMGLLTKAVFLAFLPVLLALTFLRFRPYGLSKALSRTVVFLLIAGSLGSYKYIDNYVYYGNPAINNIDPQPDWAVDQRKSYRGWHSYVDVNVARLIVSPRISNRTNGAYPVLLYATFWYPHGPDSNFEWTNMPIDFFGSLIYLFAPIPTVAFLVGLAAIAKRAPRLLGAFRWSQRPAISVAMRYTVFAILLLNAAILMVTVTKYHVWSIVQGRLLFASFFGGLVAFGEGVEIFDRSRFWRAFLGIAMLLLTALFIAYLFSEVTLTFMGPNTLKTLLKLRLARL
jgi:4-amino-4-deoxy-L-arabinose transferase-like glycosyltransferase